MIPAQLNLLALVSGLSPTKRAERQLCMMQAYVDDSVASREVFILAGYIASVPQWLAFTQKWQDALSVSPSLSVFKMSKLKQECNDKRVEGFYRIIEETVSAGFYFAIPLTAHRKLCEEYGIASKYRSPYYMAWTLLISQFRRFHTELNWQHPLDLILDQQREEKFVTAAWFTLKERQNGDMKPFSGTPIFKSDEDVLPLQAADLLAWWARKDWLKDGRFSSQWLFPWENKAPDLPYGHSEMSESQMRTHIEKNLIPGTNRSNVKALRL